jgi:hypothetical protein
VQLPGREQVQRLALAGHDGGVRAHRAVCGRTVARLAHLPPRRRLRSGRSRARVRRRLLRLCAPLLAGAARARPGTRGPCGARGRRPVSRLGQPGVRVRAAPVDDARGAAAPVVARGGVLGAPWHRRLAESSRAPARADHPAVRARAMRT